MKRFLSGLAAAVIASGLLLPYEARGQTIKTYEHQSRTTAVYPARTLHSWMKPVVVRSRTVTQDGGEIKQVVEPIIQERYERVLVPEVETTTTTNIKNKAPLTAASKKTYAIAGTARANRHRLVASSRETHKSKVAVSAVATDVIREKKQIVERARIIERRDPALELY